MTEAAPSANRYRTLPPPAAAEAFLEASGNRPPVSASLATGSRSCRGCRPAWRGENVRAILTALAGPGSAARWEHVASGRSCSLRRPDRRDPSHVYPATSGTRSLLAASGCMGLEVTRTAPNHITRGWGQFSLVWQVLGSNQRRLSRRFYRPLPLATRATCRTPPVPGGIARIAQDVARRLADGPFERPVWRFGMTARGRHV
jgi:hypothetical protein